MRSTTRPESYSPAEMASIRSRYGREPTRELARDLGRTVSSLKQKARRLGLDARRTHTEAELRTVRELYATSTASEIASLLYGTPARVSRVYKIVEKLGLKKWRFWTADVLDRVRALHAAGLTDRLIAERMAATFAGGDDGRLQVRNIRVRLGLPANRDGEALASIRREAVRTQLATLGLVEPNDLRKRAHRRFAAGYGLPEDLRPAQVRMVLAMVDGPLTIPELKAAIGAGSGSGLLHNERRTTYQADLVARGLACRIPTGVAGSTKGPKFRYMLTSACLDLLASNHEGNDDDDRDSQ